MKVQGLLPLDVALGWQRGLGRESIIGNEGQCPACWNHWKFDSYICRHPAQWRKVSEGLLIEHELDTSIPEEAAIALHVMIGANFSPGAAATPQECQEAMERLIEWLNTEWDGTGAALGAGAMARPFVFGHIAYGVEGAIPQNQIMIVVHSPNGNDGRRELSALRPAAEIQQR